jgi:2-methylcitrate dehydratase PrpD
MSTLIEQLVDFCRETGLKDYPLPIVKDFKYRLMDILGICIAASATDFGQQLLKYASSSFTSEGSPIIGCQTKTTMEMSAFINGSYAHCLDFDDTHVGPVSHPSSVLFPTAWAVAGNRQTSVAAFAEAVLAGFAAMLVIGKRTLNEQGKSRLTMRGFHPTSAIGVFVSAMVAGKLLGLNREQMISAMGIAASQASGLLQGNKTGDSVKRIHAGWSAMCGVSAAKLALAGITGPVSALEGELGFFKAFCDANQSIESVLDKEALFAEFNQLTFKPYPTNAYIHGAIDAVAALIKEHSINAGQIDRIRVGLSPTQKQIVYDPPEVKKRPPNTYAAQFSLPFALASMIVRNEGSLTLAHFTEEALSSREMHDVMDKIDCYIHPECEKRFPQAFPAVVEIVLSNGLSIKREVLVNDGMPEKPLPYENVRRKFIDNAKMGLHFNQAEQIADVIEDLYAFQSYDEAAAHLFQIKEGE